MSGTSPDWGPWNDGGIEYTGESFVDAILRPGTRDRKVRPPEELQAALAEPRGPARLASLNYPTTKRETQEET
jgi:hypothetical protein